MKRVLISATVLICIFGSLRQKPKFNILLITVDTLRADHLSCYGYNRKTSPSIDALAKGGVTFSYAMAQRGLTWPSLTSILTSMHPRTHGVRSNGEMLDASRETVPELLKKEGYTTVAVLTNMQTAPNRGFDSIFTIGYKVRFSDKKVDKMASQAAIRWLRNSSSRPFFMWLHFIAPHRPYAPPAPYDSLFAGPVDAKRIDSRLSSIMLKKTILAPEELETIVSLYDGEIAYVDAEINKVIQEMDRLRLRDNTLIVLTADHGEEIYDRNFHFGHGCSVYDAVLRIPLILNNRKLLPENHRINPIVQSIDIAPTMFDLIGANNPSSFEGKTLRKMIFSSARPDTHSFAYSEHTDKIISIRSHQWRYVYNPQRFSPLMIFKDDMSIDVESNSYFIDQEELFFLPQDPQERTNLVAENKEMAAKLRSEVSKWMSKDKSVYRPQELTEETEEEMKALGYIQ